jgi:hypothetical protein
MGTRIHSAAGDRKTFISALLLLAVVVPGCTLPPPAPAGGCSKVASPHGSDSNPGTLARPYATFQKLADSLQPGQVGCLRAGSYGSASSWLHLSNTATSIQGYTGEQATLHGYVSLEASYVKLSYVTIDGSNTLNRSSSCLGAGGSAPLQLNGVGDVFEHNDYYQSNPATRGTGIGIGFQSSPNGSVVRFNTIHDIGLCRDLDQAVYVSHGDGVQVYDNWIWNVPHGWGVQLYPSPTNARVWGNVIDRAGCGFTIGEESANATSGNQIYHNVVTNSTGLPDAGMPRGYAVSDYWPATPGSGNIFLANDSFNNAGGISYTTHVTLSANITSDPRFSDPAVHDYRLLPGSPVSGFGLWTPFP